MNNNQQSWLAAYLYYAEPWTDFLLNAVQPFVAKTLTLSGVEQFFFIRYWERGPHIRLRFKGDNEVLQTRVKPDLQKYFEQYFEQFPSQRAEPEWEQTLAPEQRWYKNNTVQWIEYEPELERYGGETGILIAEQHFQDCSRAVLSIMRESEQFTYQRALGAAIQLHLSLTFQMGMDLQQATTFYSGIFRGWLPAAYGGYNSTLNSEQHKTAQEELLKIFSEQFEQQKTKLIAFHKNVWEALLAEAEFEQEWLNDWIWSVGQTAKELRTAEQQGQLLYPMVEIGSLTTTNIFARNILSSYVHMTNNRLGIFNRDEGYLGYLMMRSLEELTT